MPSIIDCKVSTVTPKIVTDLLGENLQAIFSNILTKHGYTLREKQAELSGQMLSALQNNKILISEAAVGIGKTHAYLIAAVLHKQSAINDFWIRCNYPHTKDFHLETPMPIVISTSSIALQQAITRDYIPEISKILLENGVIRQPLSGVVRKGKEHYICDVRLKDYIHHADETAQPYLTDLLSKKAQLDLDNIDCLNAYVKRKICVTHNCNPQCPKHESCRYQKFLKQAQSGRYDFQVCNHQYLLADLSRRAQGLNPLIPNYQAVIIDEAHKLEQAAQSIYGTEISNREILAIDQLIKLLLWDKNQTKNTSDFCDQLLTLNNQLFFVLTGELPITDTFDETGRFPAIINNQTAMIIQRLQNRINDLLTLFKKNIISNISKRQKNLYCHVERILEELSKKLLIFQSPNQIVYWLEIPKLTRKVTGEIKLCCIPKQLGKFLYRDLWNKRFPIILTSGTLATGNLPGSGDFEHIKRRIGLDFTAIERIIETSKPSPFDYKKNCLMYISTNMPFPDNRVSTYISTVAGEIERLIIATHGHATILFTSYHVMELVYKIILKKKLDFSMFKLNKNSGNIIDRFKKSGNGILFASGSMWEGIDIPGDILSLLIIVKLPFQVPDPLSEYERSQYIDEGDFKRDVILPDMILKLKQGFGRLLRSENDTGVVAILDSRARCGGAYRGALLSALPDCRVTDNIGAVKKFIASVKDSTYFQQ